MPDKISAISAVHLVIEVTLAAMREAIAANSKSLLIYSNSGNYQLTTRKFKNEEYEN